MSNVYNQINEMKCVLQNVRPSYDDEAHSSKESWRPARGEAPVRGGGPGTPEVDRELFRAPPTDCSSDDAGQLTAFLAVARVDAVAAHTIQGLHIPTKNEPMLPEPRGEHRQKKKRPVRSPLD